MHTIEIPEARIKRYIPSDLSECDKSQYIEMCALIFRYQTGEINYDEFRVQSVYKLMNMKPVQGDPDDLDKFDAVYRVSELIDSFMDTEADGTKTIKQDYIHNPVPSFKPLHREYYGPADQLTNITFGEYTTGLRIFHDFRATGDMELLRVLAAVFYRPKKKFLFIRKHFDKYNGDIREPLNSASIDARAETFKYAPIGFIYGFFLFFASFQKYLVDARIMWGGNEIDFSILFEKAASDETSEFPGIGMESLAFSLAESGAFGNITEVENTNFWKILIRMYDSRIKALETEKQESNATNK